MLQAMPISTIGLELVEVTFSPFLAKLVQSLSASVA